MKIFKIIILGLIVAAVGAGFYFRNDILKFYKGFGKQAQSFQRTDLGQMILQIQKNISAPGPLNVGGSNNQTALLQSKIITETNLQRKENGNLPALKENSKLDAAASAKANDMFLKQYFEHTSPSGVDPGTLVQNYGYDFIVAGENLILGNFSSEEEVVGDWMASPGHRANILNVRYTEMGAAIIKGTYKGQTVWIGVQEFGLPLAACSQPSDNLKNQIDSDHQKLDALSSQIDADKTQINNTDQNSAIYSQMIDDYNNLVAQYNSLANEAKEIIASYNNEVNTFNNCVNGK